MNYTFLFWAYLIIWILLALYLTVLLGKLNRLGKDLKRLEEKAKTGSASQSY